MAITLVYVVLWISFSITRGIQVTVLGFTVPCDQPVVVCPNITVEFTCSVQTNALTWIVPADINSNDDSELRLQVISSFPDPDPMGIYTASLIEGNLTYLLSSLSFMTPIDSTNSNKDIVCVVGSDDSGPSCSFSIEGIPSSPINPSVIGISIDTVNVSWSTPTNGNSCINHYTVTIISNGTSMYEVANTTHLVIDGLIQGSTYSFTVQAVDSIGRVGDTSESVTLLLDVPAKVKNLMYFVSSVMDPYSVNANWNEIDSTNTLTPPVTHYNIYHNISSSITESFDTSVTFHNVFCNTLYLITVNAENIIGEGGNSSISIFIHCETSSIITVSSTDTVITSKDVFSVSTATSVVESILGESSSTTQTNSISCCSCTMTEQVCSDTQTVTVSTVVTSVLVSVISVLISSSMVYLVMKRKYTSNGRDYPKNEESNNKATVIYDLPNVAVNDKTIQPNAAYGVT